MQNTILIAISHGVFSVPIGNIGKTETINEKQVSWSRKVYKSIIRGVVDDWKKVRNCTILVNNFFC